jgi:hypothetical protein
MSVQSTINNAAIIAFSSNIHERAQQKQSRLKPYVELRSMEGKYLAYDGMGTIEVVENNARFAPVVFQDMEFNRRRISRHRFVAAVPIDGQDVEQMLYDPESKLSANMMLAFNRQFDRVIQGAMFSNVYYGENFENVMTAAQDGVITVDATGGYTYEILLQLRQNFIDADVGNDEDVPFVNSITGAEHTALMSELELTSGDYSHEYVCEQGVIKRAAGFDLVKFAKNGAGGASPILPVTAGVRTCFSMAKGAICVGLGKDVDLKIQIRPDLHQTTQLVATMSIGAVRTEGVLIQQVNTTYS